MKKIKVTKRVRVKVPWYERPPLLIGAIAIVLAVAGLLMAHLNRGTGSPGVLGSSGGSDTTQAHPAQAVAVEQDTVLGAHVLSLGEPFEAPDPGDLLPPIAAETLGDAADVRALLREVRHVSLGEVGPGGAGFLEAGELVAASAAGRLIPEAWGDLPLGVEHRPWTDYELHRGEGGQIYLLAFVSVEVAEALGLLAPGLDLPPPEPQPEIPWWQFWKKAPEPEELVLYQGSEILLYPDLNPVATCAVALPVEHVALDGVRRVRAGLSHPVDAIEATLTLGE
ncbi:MAG: hypothetical protein KAY32_09475 [Candidatus Eisenbacteria sp.]|nr:hypothetical protein [Candidatus Eisenbacteria bacterium]